MRPFIIALAFGIIAVVLVYFYIQKIQSDQDTSEIPRVRVVRATENIPARSTITEGMLEEIEVQEDMLTPETVTELEEILGEVSITNIYENQILMSPMFRAEIELQDPSRMLDEGERAVTVGVSEISGLGGNLMPGDNVDVLVTILSHDEIGVSSTFTVLRQVEVMAVGQNIGFEEDDTISGGAISKSVTLKVNPMNAEILTLASEVGSIRLTLRHPDDLFAPSTDGTALTDFTQYTPTRDDLEQMAARERQVERDAQSAELERIRILSTISRQPSPISTDDPDEDLSFAWPTELPDIYDPITVDLILGGQLQTVVIEEK
jgi:pilus assembly protein CpaB